MCEICQVERCTNEPIRCWGGFVGQFCSQHEDDHYECQESNCPEFISYQGYCSQHCNSCNHCGKRMKEYRYCDECNGGKKCNFCHQRIYKGEGSYCIDHKVECHYGSHRCSKRVGKSGEYCEDHKKECEFEGCFDRTNGYSSGCPRHPLQEQAKLYKGKRDQETNRANSEKNRADSLQSQLSSANNRANALQVQLDNATRERDNRPNITIQQYTLLTQERNNLQNQFNVANGQVNNLQTRLNTINNRLTIKQQEIEWLKNQLRIRMSQEEYQSYIEVNYPPQFKNN